MLALDVDGTFLDSRLWAKRESLALADTKALAVQTNGDGTACSVLFDILRRKNWPKPHDFRAVRNALHRQWADRIDALRAASEAARALYECCGAGRKFSSVHTPWEKASDWRTTSPAPRARPDQDGLARLRQLVRV